jgi:superfamily II DNA/RNA helicase
MSLRKITKNRESFPSDDVLLKLFCLALANISKKWTIPLRDLLVFVATKHAIEIVANKLHKAGIEAEPFHGVLSQGKRPSKKDKLRAKAK